MNVKMKIFDRGGLYVYEPRRDGGRRGYGTDYA